MSVNDEFYLLNEKYKGVRTREYEKDLALLNDGVPLDYVIGWKPFLDAKIYLDSHPLIPRLETEYWTEEAIRGVSERNQGEIGCLDLFAGSGAVGIALLKRIPNARMDFGELDRAHFRTIRKNIRENGIEVSRTKLIETDVWSHITGRYDVILANPPYLSRERMSRIQPSVLDHEPHLALIASENGLALIRSTLEGARQHLSENALLYIEHEPEQTKDIEQMAVAEKFLIESRKDQYGQFRYSILKTVA